MFAHNTPQIQAMLEMSLDKSLRHILNNLKCRLDLVLDGLVMMFMNLKFFGINAFPLPDHAECVTRRTLASQP